MEEATKQIGISRSARIVTTFTCIVLQPIAELLWLMIRQRFSFCSDFSNRILFLQDRRQR
jgi:hypothetical protein